MTHKQKCRVSMGQKWAKKRAKIWHFQTNNDQSQRSRQKNASWCLKMSNFSGKQQQKFKYYVSNSQSDKIWDVPKMWYQHNKFLRSNTRAWFCVNTWTIPIFPKTLRNKFEIFLRSDSRTCPQILAINKMD